MFEADKNGVYATVHASSARRWFAYAVLVVLGALLIYTTAAYPPALPWMIFMLSFGFAMLWLAEMLRRATTMAITLTETDLRDSSGTVLAELSQVRKVSRGAFALKPSNGFTLVMTEKQPRAWAPGLWWRLGRRVGVGGVTAAGQSRFLAEQIALRIERHTD